jgi:tetratricopeptide (TPR) repeat protein/SAM-dependent methyltransferase
MEPTSQTVTIPQALQIAMDHHNLGRLSEAGSIYQRILQVQPDHPDALHLLGLIAYQTGHLDDAVRLIGSAVGVQPTDSMYCNLGNALKQQGNLAAAAENYRKALELQPGGVETRCNLANTLLEQGNLDEAIGQYRTTLAGRPDLVDAHIGLGNAHRLQGRQDAAIASFRQATLIEPDDATALVGLGLALQAQGKLDDAIACHKKALSHQPGLFDAHHNLAVALHIQGKLDAAIASYQEAISLKPDLENSLQGLAACLLAKGEALEAFDISRRYLTITESSEAKGLVVQCLQQMKFVQDDPVARQLVVRAMSEPWARPMQLVAPATSLINTDPNIRSCIERATQAWPARLSQQDLYGPPGVAAVAMDSLLRCLLEHTPACSLRLEIFLTAARFLMLKTAMETSMSDHPDAAILAFHCALARQCFINEYVYTVTDEEFALACALSGRLVSALQAGNAVPALWVAAVAAYFPLTSLPSAETLMNATWPDPVSALLRQQVREPREELQYRAHIPRLTEIDNEVSQQVREQYEENPYPRWVKAPSGVRAIPIDDLLRQQFPFAPFKPLGKTDAVDILIAGCGTGQHPIRTAQEVQGARVLAVDLSLASLCYAQRKTSEIGLKNIEYAQADIMKLGAIDRRFDLIESVGVLHHLAEPMAGWRVLVSLLRSGGLMRLGFYSEAARRNVVSARQFIAKQGYAATPEDIRRFRQELISMDDDVPIKRLAHFSDFFSMSDCRDLLFHVQEHRFTLPQIKDCLNQLGLRFLGFSNDANTVTRYRARFPDDAPMTNLDNWHTFECEYPDTFAGMYQFLAQK